MIRSEKNNYILETANTTYCFRVTDTGHLEHLYYGRKITLRNGEGLEGLIEKHAFAPGNSTVYDDSHKEFSMEDIRFEVSGLGKGDIRDPFVEVIHSGTSLSR